MATLSRKLLSGARFINTTDSSSTTTGALTVAGGIGVGAKLHTGDSVTIDSGGLQATGDSQVTGSFTATTGLTVSAGGMNVTGDTVLTGNLQVTGNTTTVTASDMYVEDNFIFVNAGNEATGGLDGGFCVSYKAVAAATNVDTAGFSSTTVVNVVAEPGLGAGDFIQITGAADVDNNGIYEVASVAVNAITITGAPTHDFCKTAFVTDATAQGSLTHVNVSVMIAPAADGVWQIGQGSDQAGLTSSLADIETSASLSGYALLAGRAAGQTLYGGDATAQSLTLGANSVDGDSTGEIVLTATQNMRPDDDNATDLGAAANQFQNLYLGSSLILNTAASTFAPNIQATGDGTASYTYTFPNAGANADVVLTESAQTINGDKTFNDNTEIDKINLGVEEFTLTDDLSVMTGTHIVEITNAAPQTITTPASAPEGMILHVVKTDANTNTVTLAANAGSSLNESITLDAQYDTADIILRSGVWFLH